MLNFIIIIIMCFKCSTNKVSFESNELHEAMVTVEDDMVKSLIKMGYLDGIDIYSDNLDKIIGNNDILETFDLDNLFKISVEDLFVPDRDNFKVEDLNILNKNRELITFNFINELHDEDYSLELGKESFDDKNNKVEILQVKTQILEFSDKQCYYNLIHQNSLNDKTLKTTQEISALNIDMKNRLNFDNTNLTPFLTPNLIENSKSTVLETKKDALESSPLKRKIDFFYSSNSSYSDLSLEISKFTPKKKCFKRKNTTIIESPNSIIIRTSNNLYNLDDHTFLKRFENFLGKVEESFNAFFADKLPIKNINIKQILYVRKFNIVENFNANIFGLELEETLEISKKLSSTYDILNLFINEFIISENIIESLRDCIDKGLETCNIEMLAHYIETSILNFLNSSDSKYIISFLPQLKSYINNNQSIEILYDLNVFKGFIIFLFLLKRNHLYIQDFRNDLSTNFFDKEIRKIFLKETLHNLIFLNVFFNYWPIKLKKNILTNILAIIEGNLALLNTHFTKKLSENLNFIFISEHYFFELMKYEIFPDVKKLLNFEISKSLRSAGRKIFSCNFNEVYRAIENLKLQLKEEFNNEIYLSTESNSIQKMKSVIKNQKYLSTSNFKHLLVLINRYNVYEFKRKKIIIDSFIRNNKIENRANFSFKE